MGKSVLIVDDEEAVREALGDYFRSQGHEVDSAGELEEAGALLSCRRYDAAILDLRLTSIGGVEGLSVLEEIRGRDRSTRVLLLSACISPEVHRRALEQGASGVLQKPFPLPELERLAFGEAGAGGDAA